MDLPHAPASFFLELPPIISSRNPHIWSVGLKAKPTADGSGVMSFMVEGNLLSVPYRNQPGRTFKLSGAVSLSYINAEHEISEEEVAKDRRAGWKAIDQAAESAGLTPAELQACLKSGNDHEGELSKTMGIVSESSQNPSLRPDTMSRGVPKPVLDAFDNLSQVLHRHHRAFIPFSDWYKHGNIETHQTEIPTWSSMHGTKVIHVSGSGDHTEKGAGMILRDYNPHILGIDGLRLDRKLGEYGEQKQAEDEDTTPTEFDPGSRSIFDGKLMFSLKNLLKKQDTVDDGRRHTLITKGIFEPPFSVDDIASNKNQEHVKVELENDLDFRKVRKEMEGINAEAIKGIKFDGQNLAVAHVSLACSHSLDRWLSVPSRREIPSRYCAFEAGWMR
jgi:hypothetical protein